MSEFLLAIAMFCGQPHDATSETKSQECKQRIFKCVTDKGAYSSPSHYKIGECVGKEVDRNK